VGLALKYIIPFIAVIFAGQDPQPIPPPPAPQGVIQSQSVPPLKEESWVFQDAGNQYFVGKETGSVTVIRGNSPAPNPNPGPAPTPNPPPVPSRKVAWVSLIVDPADSVGASFRTDPQARLVFNRLGVEYRTYLANEQDIAELGFQQIVQQIGLPMVITQDKDGSVIASRKITDAMDWTIFYEGLK
jgi:hypothetical protein